METYKAYIQYKNILIILLIAATVLCALIALSVGSSGLPLREVLLTLIGKGSVQSNTVIFNIRMPRIITAIVAGTGLAASGCVMQSLMKNPLASSSTLGISQGAAFGASFAIIVLGAGMQNQTLNGVTISNPYLVSICAFIGAILSTLIVLGLSSLKKVTPEAMILSGVALSTMFLGGNTLLQYFAADVKVAAVVFWTFGDLGRTGWIEVAIMGVIVLLSLIYYYFNHWNFNALLNGEETAKGLGVNVSRMRIVGMLVCSAAAAAIVSFVGIINFIGLISPHLVRRFIGSDYRYLMPAASIMGALLLLLSDTAARLVVAPIILPIGAVTSILGAPLFLYLLFQGVGRK